MTVFWEEMGSSSVEAFLGFGGIYKVELYFI